MEKSAFDRMDSVMLKAFKRITDAIYVTNKLVHVGGSL